MRLILRALLVCLTFLALGCATTPKETVELSEIVDQQIMEMQRSHESFIGLYYEKLREEVDGFMEQKWIPFFLSNTVNGVGGSGMQFRKDLDKAYKLSNIDWENTIQIKGIQDDDVKKSIIEAVKELTLKENVRLGMVLLDFSKAVQEQINARRKSLMQPIDDQERYVLDQLRLGYADLLRSNAAIKGHLAAAVKLTEERDLILEKAGALENQRKIISTAVEYNDKAARALNKSKNFEENIDDFLKRIQDANERIKEIKAEVKNNGL